MRAVKFGKSRAAGLAMLAVAAAFLMAQIVPEGSRLALLSLVAAAILIPTVIAQDLLTVWTYRRDWSAWNVKVMVPGMMVGVVIGTLFAASLAPVHIRLAIGLIAAAFVLGMTTFGESAPAEDLYKHFGFTVDNVVARAKALL